MNQRFSILVFGILAAFFLTSNAYAENTIQLEVPGFKTEATVFSPDGASNPVEIALIHGKSGTPHGSFYLSLADALVFNGYKVIAPVMPWSRLKYSGTQQQSLALINAAVKALGTNKVVVIGHSMGGMAVLQYAATRVAPNVIGVISVAPAHDPHHAQALEDITSAGADRACDLMAAGKGSEVGEYDDLNGPREYMINATAEYYCTFYSTSKYPDSQEIGKSIKVPFYLISGEDDRLTEVYSHDDIFNAIPDNPKSKHDTLPGRHMSVLPDSADAINTWIQSLVK